MEVDTAEHLPSGPSVDSSDAKRQMEINIGKGVSLRAAYEAMRKQVRVEAITLSATVELTPSTNIILVTISVQDTGRWTVGASATERRASGT